MKGKAWGWELVLGGYGVFIQNWFGYQTVLSHSLTGTYLGGYIDNLKIRFLVLNRD